MGDGATIVTETDSQYLRDALPDFNPDALTPEAVRTKIPEDAPQPAVNKDTLAKGTATTVPVPPAGNGLTADFGDLNVMIPGLEVRNAGRSVKGQTSVAYSSEKASADALKNLMLSGSMKVESVQQKADYGLVWTAEGKALPLSKTGVQSAGWQMLPSKGGNYKVAALNPPAFKVSASTLRAAATDAVKRGRFPRTETNTLNSVAGKLRSVDGSTVKPVLRTLIWQVKGKDSKGRAVSHEIRIDMPAS